MTVPFIWISKKYMFADHCYWLLALKRIKKSTWPTQILTFENFKFFSLPSRLCSPSIGGGVSVLRVWSAGCVSHSGNGPEAQLLCCTLPQCGRGGDVCSSQPTHSKGLPIYKQGVAETDQVFIPLLYFVNSCPGLSWRSTPGSPPPAQNIFWFTFLETCS